MKVIIRKETKELKLGEVGQIIEVKDGYALNYLIPKQIVLPAHQATEKIVAENLRQASQKKSLVKQKAIALAQKIKQQTIILEVKAADKGKIFGNITNLQIAQAITAEVDGATLTHDQITLKEPIKEVGSYTVILKLHPEVETEITIEAKAI